MPPPSVVFFGTPEFAVPSLGRLLDAGVDVALAVTRPDRPVGRHSQPRPSPVAALASARGVPVEKPERLRGNEQLLGRIRGLRPDLGVVVAYGKILPAQLLEMPRLGFVNVHASLLPRHRGASPVQAALLAGERETGVVTMRVVPELDAGPVYLTRRVAIGDREDAEAQWTLPAEALDRRLRAFTPWPGLHTRLHGERVKILSARPGPPSSDRPGTLRLAGGEAVIAAGEGTSLLVETAQREGRRPVSGAELARVLGAPVVLGT